jgi:tetratricopeptide (TPR) repeat protein
MKKDFKLAFIPFLITQIIYLLTLAPTVTSEDSGEFIAAASKLGVAHPPGYPLFCILGYFFSLIPIESVAWRLAYMSAFFASLTCGVVYLIIRHFQVNVVPAIVAACLLGFSWHFWNQSIIAEVYSLNAFLFALMLLYAFLLKAHFSWSHFNIFCMVVGFALTNHYMLVLLMAPPLGLYLLPSLKKNFEVKSLVISIVCLVLPLSLYLYLYFAAQYNPAVNWGDPSDLDKLIKHIRRDAYKSLELEKVIPFSVKITYYYQFVYLLFSQFTALIFVPFLFWGMKQWWARKIDLALLLGVIVFNSFVLVSILKFTAEEENFTRVEEYYLPAYMAIAILLSFGINNLYVWLRQYRYVSLGVLLLPLICINSHWKENDFSKYYLAYDYNKAILDDLPKDAIYFPSGDYNSFPLIYLQAVEGVRKDILIADITGDIEKSVVAMVQKLDPDQTFYKDLKERIKDRYPDLKPHSTPVLQKVLIEKGTRPVFFTSKSDIKPYPEYSVYQYGLVYHALKKGEKSKEQSKFVFSDTVLRNIKIPTADDDLGQSILSNFYQMWGESLIRSEKIPEGLEKFDKAIQYSFFSKEGLNNLGSALAELGQSGKAITVYERAIRLHPDYVTGRVNLMRSYQSAGDNAKADLIRQQLDDMNGKRVETQAPPMKHQDILKELQDKLKGNPNDPNIIHDIGVAYANLGDMKKAQESFEKALEIKPDYESAIRNLLKVYQATGQSVDKQNELLNRLPK